MKHRFECISDRTILLYQDNQLDETTKKQVDQHLSECAACASKAYEMAQWAAKVKQSLAGSPMNVEIPEFIYPAALQPNKEKRIRIYSTLKIAALIAIIISGYLVITEKQRIGYQPGEYEMMLWEEVSSGDDANQTWHSRELPILITDSRGETDNQY